VDLVGNDAYVYWDRLKGPGGLPLSAQWKMLTLLDRGPLSVLAACAMMRRGCVTELFIPLSNRISDLTAKKQLPLAEKMAKLVTRPNHKAFTVEIDEVLDQQRGREFSWRAMVRAIAVRFARENRFKGLVFGDITGNLSALNSATVSAIQTPIFHPLLGLERDDLVELSKLIGIGMDEVLASGGWEDRTIQAEYEVGLNLEKLQLPSVQELKF